MMVMAISWPNSFEKQNVISPISYFPWALQEVSQNERKAMNLPDNESGSWFIVLSCRQNYRFLVNLKEVEWRSSLSWYWGQPHDWSAVEEKAVLWVSLISRGTSGAWWVVPSWQVTPHPATCSLHPPATQGRGLEGQMQERLTGWDKDGLIRSQI